MSCQTIYVMFSSFLSEEEKRIVAAHELGHIILHRAQLKMAPMSDNRIYNMINETEYQANLFAADLLIEDEAVEQLSKNEDLDYFSFCSSLYATPELMSFKLYSLMKRGQKYNMPMDINVSRIKRNKRHFSDSPLQGISQRGEIRGTVSCSISFPSSPTRVTSSAF